MQGRRPLQYPVKNEEFQPNQQMDNFCVAAACVGDDVMQDVEAAQAFYDLKTLRNFKTDFLKILRAAKIKDSVKAMYCALQFAGNSLAYGADQEAANAVMGLWVYQCKQAREKSPTPLTPDQYPKCPIGQQALMVHMIDYHDTFRWHNNVYLAYDIQIRFNRGISDTSFAIYDAYVSMANKAKQGYLYYKLYVDQFMEMKDGVFVHRSQRNPKRPLFYNAPTPAHGYCENARFTTSPVRIEAADLVDLEVLYLLYSTSRSLKDLERHVLDLIKDPDLYWDKKQSYKALLSALKFDQLPGPEREMIIFWAFDRIDVRNGVFSRSTPPTEFPLEDEDPSIFTSMVDLHGSTRWQFLSLVAPRLNKAFAALEKGLKAVTIGDMMRSIRDTTEEGDTLYAIYEREYRNKMDSCVPEPESKPKSQSASKSVPRSKKPSPTPAPAAALGAKRYLFQLPEADKKRLQDHPHGKKLIKGRVEIKASDVADLEAARALWEIGSMRVCELRFWSIMESSKPEPEKLPYKMIYAALKFRQLAVAGDDRLNKWMGQCLDLRDRNPLGFQERINNCPLGHGDVYRCIVDYFATTRYQINYMVASTMLQRFEQREATSGVKFDAIIENMRSTLYEGAEIADLYKNRRSAAAPSTSGPKLLPLPNIHSKYPAEGQFQQLSEAMRKFRFEELDDIHALQQFSESVTLANFKTDFLKVFRAAKDKEPVKAAYAAFQYAAQDEEGKAALDRWALACTKIRDSAPQSLKPNDYPQSPIGNNTLMVKMVELYQQLRWKVDVYIATHAVLDRPVPSEGDPVLAAFEKMATEFRNGHWAYSLYIERFYNVVDGVLVKKPVHDTDLVNPYTNVTTPRHMTLFHPIADPKIRANQYGVKLQRGRVKISEADLEDFPAALAIMDFGSTQELQRYVAKLEYGLYGADLPYFEIKDSIYAIICAIAYTIADDVAKQRTQEWVLECMKRRDESATGEVKYEPCPLADYSDAFALRNIIDLFGTTRWQIDLLLADTVNKMFMLRQLEKKGIEHGVTPELGLLFSTASIAQDYAEGEEIIDMFSAICAQHINHNEPRDLPFRIMTIADLDTEGDNIKHVFDYALGVFKVRDRDLSDVDAAYELYELGIRGELESRLKEIAQGGASESLRNMYAALLYLDACDSVKEEFLAWCEAVRDRMWAYVEKNEFIEADPNDLEKPLIPLKHEDYPDPPLGDKKTMLGLALVEGTTKWNVDVWLAEAIRVALDDRHQRIGVTLLDMMARLARQVPEGLRLYHMIATLRSAKIESSSERETPERA